MKVFLSLCLAALVWAAAPPARAEESVPRWEPAACPVPPPGNVRVECGFLVVPEDHQQPGGRTIRVAVAILKSPHPDPAPDPLVYLNGGPGAHTLQFLAELAASFEPFLASRDVILFDQRGLGFSQPALDCPEIESVSTTGTTQVQDFDSLLPAVKAALTTCRDRHEGQGVNLAAYTSAQSAADLDALRAVLGYDAWNLFGASYGTRYALTVMRDRPAGIRSVILASVYPPQVNLHDAVPNADRAYNALFEGCAADPVCNFFYPDLKTVFYDLVARLTAEPVTLDVETESGEIRRRTVDGDLLMDAVFNLLYSADGIALLPALIYDLHDGLYAVPRQMLAESMVESSTPLFSEGMAFSVQCNEEVPFTTREALRESAAPYPEPIRRYIHQRLLFTDLAPELCTAWRAGRPLAIENEPVQSDLPTLVLAGHYDPGTPPAWSQSAASYLSRSYYYEFPSLGHVIRGVCPTGLMLGFLADPAQPPDAGCIGRMDARPQFIIRAEVSRWPVWAACLLLGAVVIAHAGRAGRAVRRGSFSWRVSAKLIGWIPFAVSGAVVLAFLLIARSSSDATPLLALMRVVETVVPLAAALHAALLFSPDDEPGLEVTLAAPRPLAWVLVERWALAMAGHGTVGLLAGLLSAQISGEAPGVALARWLVPMCVLAGAAVCLTLSTRQPAFSAGLMLLFWFGLSWAGDGMLTLLPFLWPAHVYLQPDHDYYWLNRALLGLLGLSLIVFAARIAGDDERMLLGQRAARRGRPAPLEGL